MSAPRQLMVERLLGTRVCDANGAPLGRIADICAGPDDAGDDGGLVVRYYLVGPPGSASQLSATNILPGIIRLLGVELRRHSYIVPWQEMDLSDPDHPRTRRRKAELQLDDTK